MIENYTPYWNNKVRKSTGEMFFTFDISWFQSQKRKSFD